MSLGVEGKVPYLPSSHPGTLKVSEMQALPPATRRVRLLIANVGQSGVGVGPEWGQGGILVGTPSGGQTEMSPDQFRGFSYLPYPTLGTFH